MRKRGFTHGYLQLQVAEADSQSQPDQEPMMWGLGADWVQTGPVSKEILGPLAWEQQLGG